MSDSYPTTETIATTKSGTVNKFLIVLTVFFVISAFVFGILYLLVAPQSELILNDEPRVYTFTQIYGKPISNEGKSSLSCPADKKIVITQAEYYVYDPYFQCYPTQNMTFQPPNTSDTDSTSNPNRACGPYWTGGTTNSYIASGHTGEDDAGSPTSTGDCVYDAVTGGSGIDRSCWGGNLQCTVKNITQYLATPCDGKNVCNITVDNKIGPAPCNLLMEVGNDPFSDTGDFSVFPKSVVVENAVQGDTPGGQQGYYVSGLFICE